MLLPGYAPCSGKTFNSTSKKELTQKYAGCRPKISRTKESGHLTFTRRRRQTQICAGGRQSLPAKRFLQPNKFRSYIF
jgi:hypothetical protein